MRAHGKNPYHVCASCIHFEASKVNGHMKYYCKRLGYETKPDYVFNCWDPKKKVKDLMIKRSKEAEL
ncbi:hypothetical protein [Falsibacillus pallidus]|uniref:Uncharacterized protein n=1 Tax=Falsibacillus pallidus TaxID=493781 RepID=A0A370GI62_9BACI|nr:hypothetical protein [Falsibacillus pallidus]RDI43050.1 hypothetical protein DFR59_104101 [Falsibacillus pallidus]